MPQIYPRSAYVSVVSYDTTKYVQLLWDSKPAHLGCQIYPAPRLHEPSDRQGEVFFTLKGSVCRIAALCNSLHGKYLDCSSKLPVCMFTVATQITVIPAPLLENQTGPGNRKG